MIDNIDLYQVIKRLRGGDIEPIGETHVDSKRLDMQYETQALIKKLIRDIVEIAELESFAGSIEEAHDEAVTCLTNIKECIEEVIEQDREVARWANNIHDLPICSKCGNYAVFDHAIDDYCYSDYCPKCGARMENAVDKIYKESER